MRHKLIKSISIFLVVIFLWQNQTHSTYAVENGCLRPLAVGEEGRRAASASGARKESKGPRDPKKENISVNNEKGWFIRNYIPAVIDLVRKGMIIFGEGEWPEKRYKYIPSLRRIFGIIAHDSNNNMAGIIIYARKKNQLCKILRILVHEDYAGYGVESVLIEHLKSRVRPGGGIRKILTFIRERDDESRKLFQGFGFRADTKKPVRRGHYQDGEDAYVFVYPPDIWEDGEGEGPSPDDRVSASGAAGAPQPLPTPKEALAAI